LESSLKKNFWYIILDEDFESAVVRRLGKEDVVAEFGKR